MRSILKILAFTALLLISKFTKEDEEIITPAESSEIIVSTNQPEMEQEVPVIEASGNFGNETVAPPEPVHTLITTPATIK